MVSQSLGKLSQGSGKLSQALGKLARNLGNPSQVLGKLSRSPFLLNQRPSLTNRFSQRLTGAVPGKTDRPRPLKSFGQPCADGCPKQKIIFLLLNS